MHKETRTRGILVALPTTGKLEAIPSSRGMGDEKDVDHKGQVQGSTYAVGLYLATCVDSKT